MVKYKVVRETGRDNFEGDVNKALGEGYRPIGGVAVTCWLDGDRRVPFYAQAMIKEGEEVSHEGQVREAGSGESEGRG